MILTEFHLLRKWGNVSVRKIYYSQLFRTQGQIEIHFMYISNAVWKWSCMIWWNHFQRKQRLLGSKVFRKIDERQVTLIKFYVFVKNDIFGVCVANAFALVGWRVFRQNISEFSDSEFLVQTLAFCRKEPIYFKPSCFHFHANLLILVVGHTHQIL